MNLTHEQLVIFALALIAAISVGWATSATVKGGRDWDEYCSLAGYRIFTFPGDHFSVVYEMVYESGELISPGRIIAAQFVNDGREYHAILFRDEEGIDCYYSLDGSSRAKAFLRSPVEFSRISSGFGGRVHPIFNNWRAHTGVDFAALGIPGEADYVAAYCRRTGREAIAGWEFYLVYSLFRIAAILQGIAKRAIDGTAASADAAEQGKLARPLAEQAWQLAQSLKT